MTKYVIGDVQGCYEPLRRLLDNIAFDPAKDQVWFVGDLVNRGDCSAAVLRFIRSLGKSAITVLGNHDLHLLAVAYHQEQRRHKDTFDDVLQAPDCDELLDLLINSPFLHHDPLIKITMVHAGLAPQWDLKQAQNYALELQLIIRSKKRDDFLRMMYGNHPNIWSEDLSGWERLRFIANCFTRLRFCSNDGYLEFEHKGAPGSQPQGYVPWFIVPKRRTAGDTIIFGHWSTLGYYHQASVYAIDTGCIWGGRLTALCLDNLQSYYINC